MRLVVVLVLLVGVARAQDVAGGKEAEVPVAEGGEMPVPDSQNEGQEQGQEQELGQEPGSGEAPAVEAPAFEEAALEAPTTTTTEVERTATTAVSVTSPPTTRRNRNANRNTAPGVIVTWPPFSTDLGTGGVLLNWVKNNASVPTLVLNYCPPEQVNCRYNSTWMEDNCREMDSTGVLDEAKKNGTFADPALFKVRFRKEYSIEKMDEQQRKVKQQQRHNLLAIRIGFSGEVCGKGGMELCEEPCDAETIKEVFVGPKPSVGHFFNVATRGLINLNLVEVKDALTLPVKLTLIREEQLRGSGRWNFTGVKDLVKYMSSLRLFSVGNGPDQVDHVVFFLPPNFHNMPQFVPLPSTHVIWGGVFSEGTQYMVSSTCYLEAFLHEFGHMLGLTHAGALVKGGKGAINAWQDTSSVMGVAIPYELNQRWMKQERFAYRGLSAFDLFVLGVVKPKQILTIKGTMRGVHIQSLSSNSPTGLVAARAQTRDGEVFWLEWRERVNQDEDLQHAYCNSVVVGEHTGSLIVRHNPLALTPGMDGPLAIGTVVDAILAPGMSVILPLSYGADVFAKELKEFSKSKKQRSASGFVFKMIKIERGEAVFDVIDINDASLEDRVVASVLQLVVMAEFAIDRAGAVSLMQIARAELSFFSEKSLPIFAGLLLANLANIPDCKLGEMVVNCTKDMSKCARDVIVLVQPFLNATEGKFSNPESRASVIKMLSENLKAFRLKYGKLIDRLGNVYEDMLKDPAQAFVKHMPLLIELRREYGDIVERMGYGSGKAKKDECSTTDPKGQTESLQTAAPNGPAAAQNAGVRELAEMAGFGDVVKNPAVSNLLASPELYNLFAAALGQEETDEGDSMVQQN